MCIKARIPHLQPLILHIVIVSSYTPLYSSARNSMFSLSIKYYNEGIFCSKSISCGFIKELKNKLYFSVNIFMDIIAAIYSCSKKIIRCQCQKNINFVLFSAWNVEGLNNPHLSLVSIYKASYEEKKIFWQKLNYAFLFSFNHVVWLPLSYISQFLFELLIMSEAQRTITTRNLQEKNIFHVHNKKIYK